MVSFGKTACLRPTNHPKPLPPKISWHPIDTISNILSYIGMFKASFPGETGSKIEMRPEVQRGGQSIGDHKSEIRLYFTKLRTWMPNRKGNWNQERFFLLPSFHLLLNGQKTEWEGGGGWGGGIVTPPLSKIYLSYHDSYIYPLIPAINGNNNNERITTVKYNEV